jgi:hypothetical protein
VEQTDVKLSTEVLVLAVGGSLWEKRIWNIGTAETKTAQHFESFLLCTMDNAKRSLIINVLFCLELFLSTNSFLD